MNGYGGGGSFLNNDAPLPFDLNEFYRESPPPVDQNSIQVIHSQDPHHPTPPLNDFYNSLIPSKLETYNPEMSFNYQSSQPPLPSVPPLSNYQNSAPAAYMVAPPPPPASYNASSHMEYSAQMNASIPLPPQNMSDDYSWNSWSNQSSIETPHSPPHFERKGHGNNTIEYVDDSLRAINESNDVDHRQSMTAGSDGMKGEKTLDSHRIAIYLVSIILDVDHRNLISLTGSPGQNNSNSRQTNGGDQMLGPPSEPPPIFNKFMVSWMDFNTLKPLKIIFYNFSRCQNK